MRLRAVFAIVGILTAAVGAAMLTAVPIALLYKGPDLTALLVSSLVTMSAGAALFLARRKNKEELRAIEGFAIVTMGWILIPMFGSLPYILSGSISSFTDAFFESVSGFTTTGASVIADVESLPHGILYWRSLTHWIGGMGIIVLSLAILPLLGTGAMKLFKAEVAGPTKDKLAPRVITTARLLSGIYVVLTLAEVILLTLGGMPLFDSVCHAFGTIATGGFSIKNTSIAFYHSAYVDTVITIFMMLAGTNFALHYAAIRKGVAAYLESEEFVFYVTIFGSVVVIITAANAVLQYQGDIMQSLRFSAFNVASVMSCTGYATADFALWSPLAQLILLLLMFPGGCAGSTAGGIKNIRVVVLLKTVWAHVKGLQYTRAIIPVRLDGSSVEDEFILGVGGFVALYITIFIAGSLLLVITGMDVVSSASAVASCLGGVGPGLGTVGPMNNYAHLSTFAKWTLDACMVLGRLEILPVFVFFRSSFGER